MNLLQRLMLLATAGLAAAGAAGAEDLLSPDAARTAAALRDRVAAGSRASDWVKELNDRPARVWPDPRGTARPWPSRSRS